MRLDANEIIEVVNLYIAGPENANSLWLEETLQLLFENLDTWINNKHRVLANVLILDSAYNINLKLKKARLPLAMVICNNNSSILRMHHSVGNRGLGQVEDIQELRNLFSLILDEVKDTTPTHPEVGSAVSKFLHFCVPEIFPIWDGYALKSWKNMLRVADQHNLAFPPEVQGIGTQDWSHDYISCLTLYKCLLAKYLNDGDRAKLTNRFEGTPINTLLTILDKYFWSLGGGVVINQSPHFFI